MPQPKFKRGAWKAPVELRAHKTGLIAFGVLALLLLLLGRAENSLVDRVRTETADFASGVIGQGADVAEWVSHGVEAASNAVFLYGENDRLRTQNEKTPHGALAPWSWNARSARSSPSCTFPTPRSKAS